MPTKIDMNDPVIKKMCDWIEEDANFGVKPDSIEVIARRLLDWPLSEQKEKIHLCKYSIDQKEYIGFTGPASWTFVDTDLSSLSHDDLYTRYKGWFITSKAEKFDRDNTFKDASNESELVLALSRRGITEFTCNRKLFFEGETFYEFIGKKQDDSIKIVGTKGDMNERPIDYILPYYEYIGNFWKPINLTIVEEDSFQGFIGRKFPLIICFSCMAIGFSQCYRGSLEGPGVEGVGYLLIGFCLIAVSSFFLIIYLIFFRSKR